MTIAEVLNRLMVGPPRNGAFHTIAVDGRGGSGKSTLAAFLHDARPELTLVNGDDYFEPVESDTVWGAFNEGRFLRDVVEPLAVGSVFTHQPYEWASRGLLAPETRTVSAGVLVERCFSFALPVAWDVRIWVETPAPVCLARGLAREHLPREDVLRAWREEWQPREIAYIADHEPARTAHLVVDGERPFEEQVLGAHRTGQPGHDSQQA